MRGGHAQRVTKTCCGKVAGAYRGRSGEGKKLAAVGRQGEHGVLQALLDGDVRRGTAANESVLDIDESPNVLGFAVAAEAQIN